VDDLRDAFPDRRELFAKVRFVDAAEDVRGAKHGFAIAVFQLRREGAQRVLPQFANEPAVDETAVVVVSVGEEPGEFFQLATVDVVVPEFACGLVPRFAVHACLRRTAKGIADGRAEVGHGITDGTGQVVNRATLSIVYI